MNHTCGYASHFILQYFMRNEPSFGDSPTWEFGFVHTFKLSGRFGTPEIFSLKGYRTCLKIVLWEYGHWTRLSVGDGFHQFCWIVSHQSHNQLFARPRI